MPTDHYFETLASVLNADIIFSITLSAMLGEVMQNLRTALNTTEFAV